MSFKTEYKNIVLFEQFSAEEILALSSYEIESQTIDAQPDDIWQMELYIAEGANLRSLKTQLEQFIQDQKITIIGDIMSETVEDKDWVKEYHEQQKPVQIGRFLLGSPECLKNSRSAKMPIYLGASGAFGTGDHETTAGCIEAMEALSSGKYNSIFDIGTGSGILSFAAEKIWPEADILACDIEKSSIEIAEANKSLNNSRVTFYVNKADNLSIPANQPESFDLIVSNILAAPLIELAPVIKSISVAGTKIILSGFLDYQKNDVSQAYAHMGFEIEKSVTQNRWVTLTLNRL